MKNGSKNEVAVYEKFQIAKVSPDEIKEIIADTLGGEKMSPSDFERVKVPAGGGTTWTIPTFDGEAESKEFDGVIIHTEINRAYWKEPYSGGSSPPDCFSPDNEVGIGDPGGVCDLCPYDEWKSADNNRGKACQQKRVMFMLRPDSMFPIVIYVPAGSLDRAKKYLLNKLAARNKRPYSVVTRMTLEKDKNADGITFSKINFAVLCETPDIEAVKAYVEQIKPSLVRAAKETAVEAATPDPAEDLFADPGEPMGAAA